MLNIPFNNKKFNFPWFIVACIAFSVFEVKPFSMPSWLVTIFMVTPAFWFAFVGPRALNDWGSHNRYEFANWLVFAIRVAVLLAVLHFVPDVIAILETGLAS
jgi:hypothetical protein